MNMWPDRRLAETYSVASLRRGAILEAVVQSHFGQKQARLVDGDEGIAAPLEGQNDYFNSEISKLTLKV